MQKIRNVKNTARGIAISSWTKKYLYSTYVFTWNYKHTIIEQSPLSHPLRSTIDMLTRISIPDDYMRRFFYRSEISEEEKRMFPRKSCDRFTKRGRPWNSPLFCWSVTLVSSRKGEKSENIIIYFFYESILINWRGTPVSPENDVTTCTQRFESRFHTITGKDISWSHAIGNLRCDTAILEKKSKRCLVDTISCDESLSSMIWSDEFFFWISPDAITWEFSRKDRKWSDNSIFRNRLPRDCLYDHSKCCNFTGKLIFLEGKSISSRNIEGRLSECT